MNARLAAGLVIVALLLSAGAARAVEADLSDPDTYVYAQRYLLLQLNQLRGLSGAPRVELDPLACQAAKQHAAEMLGGRYLSHWDRRGLKPTRRYNLLGGYHSLGENVYRQRGGGGSLEERLQLMLDTLLESDGHRQTMLGANYTHVGLGFARSDDGRDFYGVQEFIVRVGGEYQCPLSAQVGETVEFSGRFDPRVFSLAYLVVGYEELPEPRDREWLSLTESYRDGDKLVAGYAADSERNFEGLETFHDIEVDGQQGWFSCPVRLNYKSKEGLYYLFVWLTRRQTSEAVLAAVAAVEVTE